MSGASHQNFAERYGDAVSPDARRAWLLLRDRGGWWAANEVGRKLAPGAKERTIMAGSWLRALSERGHVAARKDAAGAYRYGVTARCRPIAGETLEPR